MHTHNRHPRENTIVTVTTARVLFAQTHGAHSRRPTSTMQLDPRSLTIRRIQADIRELRTHPSHMYQAAPIEGNLLEWHFTIRGPVGTEFEGGVYHGRIVLPPEYPFKPPNIMFLTPSGRFDVRKMICLSISAFHPETWQPAWGIRLILEALISFLPTPGEGAVGAIDMPAEDRRRIAAQSVSFECPTCGAIKDLLSDAPPPGSTPSGASSDLADTISKLHLHAAPVAEADTPKVESGQPESAPPVASTAPTPPPAPAAPINPPLVPIVQPTVPLPAPAAPAVVAPQPPKPIIVPPPPKPACDTFLSVLAMLVFLCISFILWRKAARALFP